MCDDVNITCTGWLLASRGLYVYNYWQRESDRLRRCCHVSGVLSDFSLTLFLCIHVYVSTCICVCIRKCVDVSM